LKRLLEKFFGGNILYKAIVGGYRCYRLTEETAPRPEQFLHLGKNVRIESGVGIAAPERLYLGDNVGLSQKCYINAVGGCQIGRGSQIGAETVILTTEHQYTGGESLPYDRVRLVKPVFIEEYVWVGNRVSIAPGVRIGQGAIVGMGAVVFEDVPPLAIVIGNPAKVLTYRSQQDFDRLKAAGEDIDPFKEVPLLKVAPFTRRKYKNELKTFGFDVSNGQEFFQYDKFAKPGERLKPVAGRAQKPA
jgi:maltose O-acetyltransferase